MSKTLFYSTVMLATCILSTHFAEATAPTPTTRIVNDTSNNASIIGTLPYWILNANNDDILDCSCIAGQQMNLSSSLPAITKNYTINGIEIP